MRAAGYIMDDDLEAAEKGLDGGTSAFHKVGHSHESIPPGRRLMVEGDRLICTTIARERHRHIPTSDLRLRARNHERRYG